MAGLQLQDLLNTFYHLLREPYVNWGAMPVLPAGADYPTAMITAYFNAAIAEALAECGYAPGLTDKLATIPITAGLDYALPQDCVALSRVEYRQGTATAPIRLNAMTFADWDVLTGEETGTNAPGAPYAYRVPYAGSIRLWPQPSQTQAGFANALLQIGGVPTAGDSLTATFVNGATHVTTAPYVVLATDSLTDIANGVIGKINASAAVVPGAPFLQAATLAGQSAIVIAALNGGSAGNAITLQGAAAGSGNVTITPGVATALAGGGPADSIILYYSGNGAALVNPTDVVPLPTAFQRVPLYRVLADCWPRKHEQDTATFYWRRYEQMLIAMRGFFYAQSAQDTPVGFFDEELRGGMSAPLIGL